MDLPARQGNRIPRFSPFNAYATADGWIVAGASGEAEWLRMLDAVGRADLKADAQMMDRAWRLAHNDQVDAVVAAWTRTHSSDAAIAALRAHDIACSPIRDIAALKSWPHLAARGMLEPLRHPMLGPMPGFIAPGFPLKFGAAPGSYATPAPLVGADNEAIWSHELKLNLPELKASGVV
jgi:crotonobetainyl-CoA:carnitine CoA-transferase CaiB-like acyl-CoA transferase